MILFVDPNLEEGPVEMIVIGADTHKLSHAVDVATGRVSADLTVRAKRRAFEDLLV